MKKIMYSSLIGAFSLIFLLLTSCSAQTKETKFVNNPYEIEISVDNIDEQNFSLDVLFEPQKGSFITSPFATDMKGCFKIIIDENKHLIQDALISENPPSVYDEFWWAEDPVRVAKEKTNYSQKFTIQSKENFEVNGFINFVIEPKCTLEKIDFILSYQNGKMIVKMIENLGNNIVPSKTQINEWKEKDYHKNESVRTSYLSITGMLWFGSNSEGLFSFDGSTFVNYDSTDGLNNNHITSILEDFNGNLWLGTADGLCRFDGTTFTHVPIPCDDCENIWGNGIGSNQVLCLEIDDHGDIWFGTWGGGAFHFSPSEFPIQIDSFTSVLTNEGRIQADGLHHNVIQSISKDQEGNLWFTSMTHGGVSKYDGKTFTNWMPKDGISEDMVFSSMVDRSGDLWFGYLGNNTGGLDHFDGKKFTNFNEKDGLTNNNVTGIYEDKSGLLWLASHRGSLCTFDGKTFSPFFNDDGHEFDGILFITEDVYGKIWFGGKAGQLYQFDGENLIDYTQKRNFIK